MDNKIDVLANDLVAACTGYTREDFQELLSKSKNLYTREEIDAALRAAVQRCDEIKGQLQRQATRHRA
jgi:hypothetical protein